MRNAKTVQNRSGRVTRSGRRRVAGLLALLVLTGRANASLVSYLDLIDYSNNHVPGSASTSDPAVPSAENGHIPLASFAVNFTRTYTPGAVSGGTLGPTDFTPVALTDLPGPQTAAIAAAFQSGTRFKTLTIDIYRSSGGTISPTSPLVAKWLFKSLTVETYQPGTAGEDGSEAYALNYLGVQYTYYSITSNGSLGGTYTQGWNRVRNNDHFDPDDPVFTGNVQSVQFITSAAVPEPASLGLIGGVGLLLARRRRVARPPVGRPI